ncbi:hypothetical protein B0T16DRAFT_413009 [Cercophora newfieldiana]|uniref:Uncharacterized protein n=1 Tax=Cercophora newfieldiana TaxID=92897 RepID=A0AA40CPH4_9PEZI|nr:hypothetical protein B0T16DRAFT_413009 [Cercophora newfieldiana]
MHPTFPTSFPLRRCAAPQAMRRRQLFRKPPPQHSTTSPNVPLGIRLTSPSANQKTHTAKPIDTKRQRQRKQTSPVLRNIREEKHTQPAHQTQKHRFPKQPNPTARRTSSRAPSPPARQATPAPLNSTSSLSPMQPFSFACPGPALRAAQLHANGPAQQGALTIFGQGWSWCEPSTL